VTDVQPPVSLRRLVDMPHHRGWPPVGYLESRPRVRHVVFAAFRPAGLVGAAVTWWWSLTPTLLPRSWTSQAAVSAVCAAVGYGAGVIVAWVLRVVAEALGRWPVSRRAARNGRLVVAVVGAVVMVSGGVLWGRWQDDQRALVGMDDTSTLLFVPVVAVSVVLALVLLAVARLVEWGVVRFDHWLCTFMPRLLAHGLAVAVFVQAGLFVGNDVVGQAFVAFVNDRFGTFDTTTAEGVTPPGTPLASGGPGSLVPWDTLGYEGRNFAAGAPSTDELREFAGGGGAVVEPIRVYAGLRSAGDLDDRAALVVRELERTGAADRSVVVVATATGTGWVDPTGAASLEYLWSGDTAIASLQYSYLPSWISFLVDREKAADAGQALEEAVRGWWSGLPPDDRPLLVTFGESLGSFGSEAAYEGDTADASVDELRARTEGVLWTGPTNSNPVWNQLEDARDEGSPAWRPRIGDGSTVQFVTGPSDLADVPAGWGADGPRVLYVQHPSDPVTWWNWPAMWSRPAWIDDPKGADVPEQARWFPFVTWAQTVADLAAGFSAPPGHGHNYDPVFVAAWSAVAPPPGWTDADTERLQEFLDRHPPAGGGS
jgi:uncharacterized membrane protein